MENSDNNLLFGSKYVFKLDPTNFTTSLETPWAGDHLAKTIKTRYLSQGSFVGESWEISADSKRPSRIQGADIELHRLVQELGRSFLGRTQHQGVEILFKFLSTSSNLSVQLHPEDNEVSLAPGECGKPECWIVLEAQQDSGIYLGFKEGVTSEVIRQILDSKSDLSLVLNFIPVKTGDYFEILPGLVHALGKNLLIAEPQRILPGMTGKTFRLWDWNRKYDSKGAIDEKNGKPRELHVEQSLQILQLEKQSGNNFVSGAKRLPQVEKISAETDANYYPKNPYFQLILLRNRQNSKLKVTQSCYQCLSVLKGKLTIVDVLGSRTEVFAGESSVLDARTFPAHYYFEDHSEVFITNPADHDLELSSIL